MKNRRIHIIIALIVFQLLLMSCHKERDSAILARLLQGNSLPDEHSGAVKDSLKGINPRELSRSNRAYADLLKTIADHKMFADFAAAGPYLNKALKMAKPKKNSTHVFDAYPVLLWNKMTPGDYDSANLYLDSLHRIGNLPFQQQHGLLYAQSGYHETQDDFENVLYCEKASQALLPQLNDTAELFRLYYALSDAYFHNNLLDSAMLYDLEAIEHIPDADCKTNYALYENIAKIAEKQHNLPLALEYRQKAFDEYAKTVNRQLNNRIMEMEKRYNLSEAENRALKAQGRSRAWFMAAVWVMLLLMLIVFYVGTILKEREAAKKTADMKVQELEASEKVLRLQTEKRHIQEMMMQHRKITEVSTQFLLEYATLQEKAREMTNRIRGKDAKLGDDYECMLKEGQDRFNELAHHLFTEEDLNELFGIHQDLGIFSQSDRLFLVMLASDASNPQIAALLNTTAHKLKTRKSYLKAKIEKHATEQNNFARLLTLFNKKSLKQ